MGNGPKIGEKKKFNLPHTFIILFAIIVICAILTWVIPAGSFDYMENADGRQVAIAGTWHEVDDVSPVGPFRVFELVYEGMVDAADISFLVFITYASVVFVIKSGAFDGAVAALLKVFKGKSSLITIPVFMLIIGLGSSTIGMFEEWLPFIPVFAAIYVGMGYDALVGLAVIAFGAGMGYTGGYNVAKEYIGRKKRFGYWRDTHVRITGDAVMDLYGRFALDWRFTTREKLDLVPKEFAFGKENGSTGIQIVSCGPESPSVEVKRAMMRMITYAEKRVWLQTPYFVPDPSIFESLKMAAQSGVDVRVMIPCKPDHIFVYWATYSYVGELLRSGGRAFIYDDGFLHAKTLVVDGEVGTVGSTNFDNRSFRLNFETNGFVFDCEFAKKMENAFENDLTCHGHELTYEAYLKRGIIIRFKEAISRLLSDIL